MGLFFNHLYLYLSDSDDNEVIKVHRKPRRNAIKDSDSEEEQLAGETSVHTAEAPVSCDSSGEETKENTGRAAQKSKRTGPVDRDDSESERVNGDVEEVRKDSSPVRKRKRREKSQRHREKKEKRSRVVEKLKKKERFSARSDVSGVEPFSSFISAHTLACQSELSGSTQKDLLQRSYFTGFCTVVLELTSSTGAE